MAWTKKILRVDLTKGTCTDEPLNMDWADKYLGQRGLASKYLAKRSIPNAIRWVPTTRSFMQPVP